MQNALAPNIQLPSWYQSIGYVDTTKCSELPSTAAPLRCAPRRGRPPPMVVELIVIQTVVGILTLTIAAMHLGVSISRQG